MLFPPEEGPAGWRLLSQGCWSGCVAPCVLPLRQAPGGGSPGGSRCQAVRAPELGRAAGFHIQLRPARRHRRSLLPRAPGGSPWPACPRYLDPGRLRKGGFEEGGQIRLWVSEARGPGWAHCCPCLQHPASPCVAVPPPPRHLLFPQPQPCSRSPARHLGSQRVHCASERPPPTKSRAPQ